MLNIWILTFKLLWQLALNKSNTLLAGESDFSSSRGRERELHCTLSLPLSQTLLRGSGDYGASGVNRLYYVQHMMLLLRCVLHSNLITHIQFFRLDERASNLHSETILLPNRRVNNARGCHQRKLVRLIVATCLWNFERRGIIKWTVNFTALMVLALQKNGNKISDL